MHAHAAGRVQSPTEFPGPRMTGAGRKNDQPRIEHGRNTDFSQRGGNGGRALVKSTIRIPSVSIRVESVALRSSKIMFRSFRWMPILVVGVFATSLLSNSGLAQDRYFPLDHRVPTGVAGHWNALIRPAAAGWPQPVSVRLPSTGEVTFFEWSLNKSLPTLAPASVDMQVGSAYRFKVSGMPEFPGLELYPSVEILDRLHPPAGLQREFPIPVEITEQDIELVLQDQFVTKVIYLEQPDLAVPEEQDQRTRVVDLPVTANLIKEADLRGRPMAILRIGGRVPDARSSADDFLSRSPTLNSTPLPATRP